MHSLQSNNCKLLLALMLMLMVEKEEEKEKGKASIPFVQRWKVEIEKRETS